MLKSNRSFLLIVLGLCAVLVLELVYLTARLRPAPSAQTPAVAGTPAATFTPTVAPALATATPTAVALAPTALTTAPPTLTVSITVGMAAPDFSVLREEGTPVQLSNYRGKETVVLVFYRGQT